MSFIILDISGEEQKTENATNTNQTNVKVLSPIDYTGILALLVIYYIPAQFIERILEIFKITAVSEDKQDIAKNVFRSGLDKIKNKINELEAEIKFFQTTLQKINEKKIQKFEETYKPNFSEINIIDWTKQDIGIRTSNEATKKTLELDDFYELDTKKIDKVISKKLVILSKAYQEQAIRIWIFSLLLAIIPGVIFAYYQIGLLQILGISTLDGQIIDAFINTLFIGSGTKPIHDIMKKLSVTQKSLLEK